MFRTRARRVLRGLVRKGPRLTRGLLYRLAIGQIGHCLAGTERVSHLGVDLSVDVAEFRGLHLYLFGDDPSCWPFTRVLLGLLRNAEVFFDVGANMGTYTLPAAAHNLNLRCYAFEPSQEVLKSLRRNVALNPNLEDRIEVVPVAVGDGTDPLTFVESSNPGNSGLGHCLEPASQPPAGGGGERGYQVVQTTVDHFMKERGLRHVDVVKLDVEGAELKALRGAEHTLSCGSRPPVMLVETHAVFLDPASRPEYKKALYGCLKRHDYDVYTEGPDGVGRMVECPGDVPEAGQLLCLCAGRGLDSLAEMCPEAKRNLAWFIMPRERGVLPPVVTDKAGASCQETEPSRI